MSAGGSIVDGALDALAPPPTARVGGAPLGIVLLLILATAPFLAELWGGSYLLSLVTKAMIFAIAVISLDLLIGHGGLVSFGHAAFIGVGAYVTGIGVTEGVTDTATLLGLTILGSALFALVTGALSLRTTGVYFIMITLAFGQMLFFVLTSLATYGGDDGLTLWETSTLFGTDLMQDDLGLFYVILGTLTLAWLGLSALAGSRFGRVLRAAKANPQRVETMGFSVYRFRLAAYVIAGVVAGIAGFLFAHQAEFVSPALSSWQRSGDLIIMVVLGGMAARNGPLLGALFFVFVEEALSMIVTDWRLIFGPMLILVVLFSRDGLAGFFKRMGIQA